MPKMISRPSVLIVDDEVGVRVAVNAMLTRFDLNIVEAENAIEALEIMEREPPDIVFMDIRMPGLDGVEALRRMRETYPRILVIMMTGFPTVEGATECMKLGALDYLVKPVRGEALRGLLEKALEGIDEPERDRVSGGRKRKNPLDQIIGSSPAVRDVKSKIERVCGTDSTVLITGESGTGKDLVARTIHELSTRAENDFVPVDCSALVESLLESELFGHVKGAFTGADGNKAGLFEIANKGTFFFDEVSNLSYNIQSKLLRVIQEREFRKVGSQQRLKLDIRILCASNRDLLKAVEKGTFRNDLYYRINVVPMHIPPLRDRAEDVPLLVNYYHEKYKRVFGQNCGGFSDEAMEMLSAYPWPGNVRELQHLVEQILVLENVDLIRPEHLPPTISQRRGVFNVFSENLSLEEMEKRYIRFILHKTKGIRRQASHILGINRKTLSAKIKKYGLDE